MRTLVLDDDPVFLAVAEGLLRSLGFSDIVTELDGTSALMALAESDPEIELVLLDLNMPHLDGLAALRMLADADFSGNIVLVSGERDTVVSSAGHIAGRLGLKVCGALKKPLQLDDLKFAIETARTNATIAHVERSYLQRVPDCPVQPILHYQTQIDTRSGESHGAEALLRSATPDGLLLGPEPVLLDYHSRERRFDLTMDLFSIVCGDLKILQDAGRPQRLSLNVDARVFEASDFVPRLKQIADRHGVDCKQITLELTETQLPDDTTLLLEVIARLGIAGFDLSMDDFGSGASNFELLRQGAFCELKLDRMIVQNARHDLISRDFIRSTTDMARSLGLRLIAEGVETHEDRDFLAALGVRHIQGYLYGKPVPFNSYLAGLDEPEQVALAAS